MLPAPMNPICIVWSMKGPASGPRRASRLVEEALLDELRALLRADLDVARGEHEDLVRDALHPSVERVRQAAGEVDEALGEIVVAVLEVQDDGDRLLELVRHLLGVVERLRDDEVDADVATVAGAVDGAQDGRRPAARLVVGEDVVEVVTRAPARRQPPDVGALAVAVLHVGLRLRGSRPFALALLLQLGLAGLLAFDLELVDIAALLGEAEVHERAMPAVSEGHGLREG